MDIKSSDITARKCPYLSKDLINQFKQSAESIDLSNILDSLPNLIWITSSGITDRVYSNRSYLVFTGRPYNEALGKEWERAMHPDDLIEFLETNNQIAARHEMFRTEFRLRKYDGEYKWMLCRAAPVFAGDEREFSGYIGCCADIQQERDLIDELKHARCLLESALKTQSLFLSKVSHEIRTPLTAIIGLSESLKTETSQETKQKYVDLILGASTYLKILVNDLLDAARLEHGYCEFELIRSVFDIVTAVQSAIEVTKMGCDGYIPIHFHTNIPKERQYVSSDESRLKQIVVNLLSNAIKFTNEGMIGVYLSTANDTKYKIIIEDTGSGIDPMIKSKLFTPFMQGNLSYTSSDVGVGLGLYITKAIVNAFRGTIVVDDVHPHGTKITVILPIPTAEAPVKCRSTLRTYRNEKVLIADDNKVNRLVISSMLKSYCISYDEAENGRDAITLAQQYAYPLIFMDCLMPEMDGYIATAFIRTIPQYAHTGIVALTALSSPENTSLCLRSGMDDIITKPFTRENVQRELDKFMRA